jgi:hypothetical protein
MATRDYEVGNIPPQVLWTIVRGDSSAFQVYVTDDQRIALNIDEWAIDMEIRRSSALVLSLFPAPTEDDGDGYFTVKLTPEQSELVNTGDVFDVQLSDASRVWTVLQGTMSVIEDVTSATSQLDS